MCKEAVPLHEVAAELIAANRRENAKGRYHVMRRGKTRADKESGAWFARLRNRDAKAEENRQFHNKGGGKGK